MTAAAFRFDPSRRSAPPSTPSVGRSARNERSPFPVCQCIEHPGRMRTAARGHKTAVTAFILLGGNHPKRLTEKLLGGDSGVIWQLRRALATRLPSTWAQRGLAECAVRMPFSTAPRFMHGIGLPTGG